MSPRLIPELCVADPESAAARLMADLGFAPAGGSAHALRLACGDQTIALARPGDGAPGDGMPGPLDHLALRVADAGAALAAVRARGGALDAAETPDGPRDIPEFWDHGIRYVFVTGPEGARFELCERRGRAVPPGQGGPVAGHDHIGLAARDFGAMRGFLIGAGFAEVFSTRLDRPGGVIPVSFLTLGSGVVELYRPPADPPPRPAGARWRAILVAGAPPGFGTIRGPEGLVLRPIAV